MATLGPLEELIDALRRLPGVGQKSAQRMALHLLERDREGARLIAAALQSAAERIRECRRCRNYTEQDLCAICASAQRERQLLCVVESVADLRALEAATGYRGTYFVLHGRLSPIDGLGPRELGLDRLAAVLATEGIEEVILATNATVEGEATAHYVAQLAAEAGVTVSRIAHGVPMGGELEYLDRNTLAHAFGSRQRV